jgi:hypothetical protein
VAVAAAQEVLTPVRTLLVVMVDLELWLYEQLSAQTLRNLWERDPYLHLALHIELQHNFNSFHH